jgi:hypothetical protein
MRRLQVKNRLFVVLAVIAVFALTAVAIASFFLSPSPVTAVPVFARRPSGSLPRRDSTRLDLRNNGKAAGRQPRRAFEKRTDIHSSLSTKKLTHILPF